MSAPSDRPPLVLRLERTFDAPAPAVFDAWTSEEVLRRWWHAEPDWETPLAEVDLRVGGRFRVTMRNPQDGAEYGGGGEFREIDRPRRLAFTWTWDDAPEHQQLVEVEFSERDGATTVVLVNSGLTDEASRDSHRTGWHQSFDNLDKVLAGDGPRAAG
jgi:uncharacterized protein YndB with AHSA1/START domain